MRITQWFTLQVFLYTGFKPHGTFLGTTQGFRLCRRLTTYHLPLGPSCPCSKLHFPLLMFTLFSITKWAWPEETVNKPCQSRWWSKDTMPKLASSHSQFAPSTDVYLRYTRHLRAEHGPWFTCRRVIQDRVWHTAPFTGRNLINHSHYLSIPCTWAHSLCPEPAVSVLNGTRTPRLTMISRWREGTLTRLLQWLLGQRDDPGLAAPYQIPQSNLTSSR